jgi:hypothetical protein
MFSANLACNPGIDKITLDDDMVLQGNITFNTTPSPGDVLTFSSGAWISTPYNPSGASVEQINSSGGTIDANTTVSFINTNGTSTLLSPSLDGFEKKLVKTVGGGSMTISYNGGGDMTTLTNIGDTKTLNYSTDLGMWF